MKLLKYILIPALVSLMFVNMDCDMDPIDPNPGFTDTLFQSQEFLDYWYFEEGSWWVYKRTDTIADIYDTATVTKVWKQFIFSKYAMPYCIERYYMDVYHSSKHLAKNGQSINYESNQQGILSVNYGGGYLGSRYFFWWPVEFTSVHSSTMLDTIPINSILGTYHNVVHVRSFKGYYWISKNFGLIKIETFEGEIWELVNHRLIR